MKQSNLSPPQCHSLTRSGTPLTKVRSTSRTVTVDKAALTAILLDHSKMAQELFGKMVFGKRWNDEKTSQAENQPGPQGPV